MASEAEEPGSTARARRVERAHRRCGDGTRVAASARGTEGGARAAGRRFELPSDTRTCGCLLVLRSRSKGRDRGRPRVAGRVRDLAVSPNGKRAYAATANGGLWFTFDFGATWHPVSNWLPTPGEPSTRVARTALSCGCLHVQFGDGDDQDLDEVCVGTGELEPRLDGLPGSRNGGVGVLRLKTPITAAIADPFGDHWAREAPNLAGLGIYRLARDPKIPEVIVAATSGGVYSRTGPFVEDADWDRVESGPLAFEADDGIIACDVLWIPSSPMRLVVAVYGKRTGVYYSEDGIAGDFEEIPLPGLKKKGRLALAYSDHDTDRMHVLAKGPRLYRVTFSDNDKPTAQRVVDVPEALFGEKQKDETSFYNISVAVDPNNSEMVFIGGSYVEDGGHFTAALFRASVSSNRNNDLDFTFFPDNQEKPAEDSTYVGRGVHADVHKICLVRVGAELHGWVACDGGVFRSVEAGVKGSYHPCNDGLAVLEGGFVASHPTSDHFMILGTQDNGVLQRVGDSVWLHTDTLGGDGGGVAFHPGAPRYFLGQYIHASWDSGVKDPVAGTGQFAQPVLRQAARAKESEKLENEAASFYSGIAVAPGSVPAVVAKVAIGTNRVWVSEDWGPTTLFQNTWQTLPSGIDPRARNPRDYRSDVMDFWYGAVTATRWADDGRLFVLRERTVLVFTPPLVAGSPKWSVQVLTKTESVCPPYEDSDIELPSSEDLPPLGAWSDLSDRRSGLGRDRLLRRVYRSWHARWQ